MIGRLIDSNTSKKINGQLLGKMIVYAIFPAETPITHEHFHMNCWLEKKVHTLVCSKIIVICSPTESLQSCLFAFAQVFAVKLHFCSSDDLINSLIPCCESELLQLCVICFEYIAEGRIFSSSLHSFNVVNIKVLSPDILLINNKAIRQQTDVQIQLSRDILQFNQIKLSSLYSLTRSECAENSCLPVVRFPPSLSLPVSLIHTLTHNKVCMAVQC